MKKYIITSHQLKLLGISAGQLSTLEEYPQQSMSNSVKKRFDDLEDRIQKFEVESYKVDDGNITITFPSDADANTLIEALKDTYKVTK